MNDSTDSRACAMNDDENLFICCYLSSLLTLRTRSNAIHDTRLYIIANTDTKVFQAV